MKYDPQGNVMWVRQAIGGIVQGMAVAVAPDGNLFVTGDFFRTASFDGISVSSPTNSGGDVYLTGYYRSPDFYSDDESFAAQGDFTMFLAKYDAGGHLRGFVRAGGGEFQQGFSTAIDSFGSSYFAGRIGRSTALFGTNALSSGIGSSTFYVAKLAPFDPTLSIARRSDSTTLSWPSWATDWQLESSGAVWEAASWSSVMEKSFLVGGENVLTNADTASRSCFRLRRP